jgi:hypothetical protein
MNKILLVALIAGGTCLLYWGTRVHKATDSEITMYFTGSASDASMGIVLAGGLAVAVGAGGFLRDARKNRSS